MAYPPSNLVTADYGTATAQVFKPSVVLDISGTGSTRIFRGVVASQAAMLVLSASVVGDWCERADLGNQVWELTTVGYATFANWTAQPVSIPGTVGLFNTDYTNARVIAAADFGSGVIRLNSGSAFAVTLPTLATMSLAATPGLLRSITFLIVGAGIPTFAGTTASTTINGTAGTATVLPVGGAPVQYQFVTLTQTAVGSDAWVLG